MVTNDYTLVNYSTKKSDGLLEMRVGIFNNRKGFEVYNIETADYIYFLFKVSH